METRVVVVGAGHAGYHVSAALRSGGFKGHITLLGEEPGEPYQRPTMSKAYLKGAELDTVLLRPQSFYVNNGIDLRPERRAARIDRERREILLEDGERHSYDHLVLATGARARRLTVEGSTLDGVLHLRSRQDADELRKRMASSSRAVVVGAGFIGLEFASVARAAGMDVTVLELGQTAMARVVSGPTAAFFVALHEEQGVRFRFNTAVAEVVGSAGRVSGVVTREGERIDADLVVVGIGATPNTELAEACGLSVQNGIAVDQRLLTDDPTVSAVGDCASFPTEFADHRVRLESVQNATDQARCTADRINGRVHPYSAVPWFWTEQAGSKLQIAGLTTGYDSWVVRGSMENRSFTLFCFSEGRLLGAESVNRAADHLKVRKLLAMHAGLAPDAAANEQFDLASLARGTA